MATQFDHYFLGDGLMEDARKGVAEAIARTRAAGLPLEGYASNPTPQTSDTVSTTGSSAATTKPFEKEPKKKRA